MKRLLLIIVIAVIAGKIFAVAVVKFAENSDLTAKNLAHKLFLDKPTDEQLKVTSIPSNLQITKPFRNPIYRHPTLKKTVSPIIPVVAAKSTKPAQKTLDEKTKADMAKKEEAQKEAERRKERRKSLEEKTNAVANLNQGYPTSAYVPPAIAMANNSNDIAFAIPLGQTKPQASPANTISTTTSTIPSPLAGGAVVTPQSSSNINSWTKILVSNPTASLMSSFENLYKTHQITEAQYYTVLTAMAGSSNNESRNYGVQAAALYQNINSFKILADESQTDSVPAIKSRASSDIRTYTSPADASILQAALASGDPNEVAAVQQLQQGQSTTAAVARN